MCKIIIFSGSNFWHFYRNPFSLTVLRAEIWPTFVASVHSHPFNHSFTKWKAIGSPITSAHSAEPSSSSRRQFRFFSFSALQRVALNPTVFISVGLRRLQTVALNNSQDLCKPLFFFFCRAWGSGVRRKEKTRWICADTSPADLGFQQLVMQDTRGRSCTFVFNCFWKAFFFLIKKEI